MSWLPENHNSQIGGAQFMIDPDVRWKQRFNSYKRALSQFTKFIDKGELNELEEQGLIQAFEYTHESA